MTVSNLINYIGFFSEPRIKPSNKQTSDGPHIRNKPLFVCLINSSFFAFNFSLFLGLFPLNVF